MEGRITLDELLKIDIPTFESLVNNEFTNIEKSAQDLKDNGIINAYTKNETTKFDDSVLKGMQSQISKH